MDALTRPSNVHEVRGPDGAVAWVVPAAQSWTRTTLEEGRTLYERAAREDDVVELRGRGPVYAFATGGGRWVARRYRRGGAMAPLLGERFLRVGTPRPFREMAASAEARKRGIPTPQVLAASVYPEGPFYRGDVITEYVPRTRDLAAFLFGASAPEPGAAAAEPAREGMTSRLEVLHDAGTLVVRMARAGVEHADLNAKNVLVETQGSRASTLLVDLDKARIHPPGRGRPHEPMRERLERSLRKFERATGRALTDGEWAALRAPAAGVEAGP